MDEQEKYTDPLEKAVFLHCNIARLQPFRDGNKRTSRMVESIVLMNNDIIPVYSSKDSDILAYRKSLIHFYETKDYSEYAKYFLNRQKERINELDKKAPLPESIKLQTSQKSSKTKCLISTSLNKVQTNKIKKI
jgi:Fic family protein